MSAQGIHYGNALFRPNNLAGGAYAIDASPDGQERINRHDGHIAMGCGHNAALNGRTHRVLMGRTFGAEEDALMAIAPVIDVQRIKSGSDTQLLETVKLIFTDILGMNHEEARIGNGVFFLSGFNGIKNILRGCITIGVDDDLMPRLMILGD